MNKIFMISAMMSAREGYVSVEIIREHSIHTYCIKNRSNAVKKLQSSVYDFAVCGYGKVVPWVIGTLGWTYIRGG